MKSFNICIKLLGGNAHEEDEKVTISGFNSFYGKFNYNFICTNGEN